MRTLIILAVGVLACSTNHEHEAVESDVESPHETTGEEEVSDPVADIAEVPFPASTIRAATAPGRTYVVEMRGGESTTREVWTFEESTDEGFLLVVRDDAGNELRRSMGPWEQLESHAHFPAALTTVERVELDGELGRLSCRLYRARDPDDANTVRRFWFADDLPGAPIRMVVETGGRTTMEMRIVEHRPGTR